MPTLSVVIPTLNEVDNISPMLERLERVLEGIDWEVVFVDDDSSDGTSRRVRDLAQQDSRIRLVHRIGRRGLSSACVEGMLSSSAPYLAVLDADMQHDEAVLPTMLSLLRDEDLDLVIGSRNISGGGMGEFAESRKKLSSLGRSLSRLVSKYDVQDPMSGFFMLKRPLIEKSAHRLSGIGFKILVDILASSPDRIKFREVPYTFRNREHGTSKLDTSTLFEYSLLIADKLIGDYVPVRFALYVFAGLAGLLIHLIVLYALYLRMDIGFLTAQSAAAVAAMTANFVANNVITFRDKKLRGFDWVRGLLLFYLACSVGAVTNVALAQFALERGFPWYLAGLLGILVGAVWNFGVSSVLIWRTRSRRFARA